MNRKPIFLVMAIIAVVIGAVVSALPAGATHTHAVDPSRIDPTRLAVPVSALPAGSVIDLSIVSDNTDANNSKTHQLHTELYDYAWHRITGYRMDIHYSISGTQIQAGFLASIFPTPSDAQAALANATDAQSIIGTYGNPLPDPCPIPNCKGFSGYNPTDATKTALVALYADGPILVEAAAQVPNADFDAVKKQMEDQVYAVASSEYIQVQAVLSESSSPTGTPSTATPNPTDTSVPPLPTSTPVRAKTCKKGQHLSHGKCACKKGYKLVHGKCKKVKKKH